MILAITAMGKDLASGLDQRFGRAQHIIFYNTENDGFECMENKLSLNAPQGAGIQTAQHVVDRGAQVVITGNLGPKAFRVLDAAGIAAFTSSASSAQKAIDDYKNHQLSQLTNPNVQGHWKD